MSEFFAGHSIARQIAYWLFSVGGPYSWIARLKGGDPAAAQPLWERYFKRLVRLAHQKLRDLPRGRRTSRTWP